MIFNIVLILLGVFLSYLALSKQCPPPRVEYRFVPRSFKEQQQSPVLPSDIFDSMFNEPTPYIGGISIGRNSNRKLTDDNLNEFFISQS